MKQIPFYASFCWLLLGAMSVQANTEYIHQNTHTGRTPYLIVRPDESGPSTRKPGIYFQDGVGDWIPAVLGKVLAGDTSQGIVAEFSLTKNTGLFESVAVVDGQVVVFNIESRPDKPNSYFVIGAEGSKPVDILSGRPYNLPRIQSLRDVQVALFDQETQKGQGFLVSFRNTSPIGTGITFAGMLKRSEPKGNVQLVGSPKILDYEFHGFQDLKALIHPDDQRAGTIPDDALRGYITDKPDDPPVLRTWRRNLALRLDSLRGSAVTPSAKVEIPRLDLITGTLKLGAYPQKIVGTGLRLNLVYDPRDGNHRVYVVDTTVSDLSKGYLHSGPIDYDEESRTYSLWASQLHNHVLLGSSNGELVAFVGPATGNGTAALFPNIGVFALEKASGSLAQKDISFVCEVSKDASEELTYLFVSRRIPTPKTDVYIISRTPQHVTLKKSYTISNQFFSQEILSARVRTMSGSQKVFFDTVTPYTDDMTTHRSTYRDTFPHLSVGESTGNTRVQVYLKPLEEIRFNSHTVFRVFDPTGADSQHSGLYLIQGADKPGSNGSPEAVTDFIPGQLLKRPESVQPLPTLAVATLAPPSPGKGLSLPDAAVTLVAMDSSSRDGRAGFDLVFSIVPFGGGQSYFLPFSTKKNEPSFSFRQVKTVQVLPGQKKFRDRLAILITVEPDPASTASDLARQGGLVVLQYRLGGHRAGDGPANLNFSEVYYRRLIGPEATKDITSRIHQDQDGKFYLSPKRDVEKDDPNFRLYDLFSETFKEVFPNRGSAKIKLHNGEELKGAGVQLDEETDLRRVENPWQIFSRPDLKRLSNYNFEEKDKSEKDSKPDKDGKSDKSAAVKRIEDELKAYPHLDSLFDRLADPDKPNRHLVLLVAEDQKETFRALLLSLLTRRAKGSFRFDNHKLRFAVLNPDHVTQSDVLQNLGDLRELRAGERSVLLADAKAIIDVERPEPREDQEVIKYVVDSPEPDPILDLPHLLDLLSREGRVNGPSDFARAPHEEKKVTSVILATVDEWRVLQEVDKDRGWASPCADRFDVSSEFLHSNWRIWPAGSKPNRGEIQGVMSQSVSMLDKDFLPELVAELEALADPQQPARHVVRIVPDELRGLVKQIIFRLYGGKGLKTDARWNSANTHLKVFALDRGDGKQAGVLKNFQAMRRDSAEDRSVLIAPLEIVREMARPSVENDGSGFFIQDPAAVDASSPDIASGSGEDRRRAKPLPPHFLYLAETEGRRISATEFPKFKESERRVSTLFIGTQEEWDASLRDLTVEDKLRLAERWEVKHIEAPSEEARKALVNQVLDRPEVDVLRYRYVTDSQTENARQQIVGYLVNKTEGLAAQFGLEKTTAFKRVLDRLLDALVDDSQARKSGIIDIFFVERLLTRVFNIPMNLAALPPDDVDVRLSDTRKIAFALQQAGHLGPIGTKFRFVEAAQAHLRGGNLGKTVPSSAIVFGDSSTGKTLLLEKLIEVLDLRVYDFNNPSPDANAFFVRVAAIEESGPDGVNGSGKSIDDVIRNFENFLTLPDGYRGFVFIDDLDKAKSPAILNGLIGMLNRLFEARGGIVEVKDIEHEIAREVSVGNIRVFMTLNPPTTPEKRRRFAASKTDVDMIVAALSRDGVEVHPAFVMRWGAILKLPIFEAKGPALLGALRADSRHDFNNQGRFLLVDPDAVGDITKRFPDSNAREFLGTASNTLLGLGRNLARGTKVGVILPSERLTVDGDGSTAGAKSFPDPYVKDRSAEVTGLDSGQIADFVKARMTALPAGKTDLDGRLITVSMLIGSLRSFLYEKFTEAVMQDPVLAESANHRNLVFAPLLTALVGHLTDRPALALRDLNLDPHDFGITEGRQEAFSEALKRADIRLKHEFFPYKFADEFRTAHDVRVLREGVRRSPQEPSRVDLLLEVSMKAAAIERQLMSALLRVTSVDDLPRSDDWIRSLDDRDLRSTLQKIGVEIFVLFKDYWDRLYDLRFVETRRPENFSRMTTYDAVRMFLFAIDKGLTRLPWASIQTFLFSAIEKSTTSLDLQNKPGFQNFLFKDPTSIFRPPSYDFVFQQAESSETFRHVTGTEMASRAKNFSGHCRNFLIQVADANAAQ